MQKEVTVESNGRLELKAKRTKEVINYLKDRKSPKKIASNWP